MLHISLFSGIGGFDLAAEWMGWTNIVSCEINDFGNKVLEHYWPNAYHHRDVKTLTLEKINKQLGENWRTDDVILTGGFPCQPYSSAGKRKGKEDERHLWPEMLRVIREIKPSYIVGENVAGLLSWSGGLVFDEVHSDLEASGYEVQAVVIPAAAVNAPHGRDRVWFIAHSNGNTTQPSRKSGSIKTSWSGNNDEQDKWGSKAELNNRSPSFSRTAPYSNSRGLEGSVEVRRDSIDVKRESESWTAPHSKSNGLHTSDSGHEEQPSEGRLNAQRDADEIYKKQSVIEHSNSIRQKWRMYKDKSKNAIQFEFSERNTRSFRMPTWDNFPTVSPVRMRNDGVSDKLLRFVVNEFYDTISCTSQENRIKNLQEVWEKIQSEEVWEKIRRLYTLESKIVLFQTMQLYSSKWNKQRELSPFSKEFCKPILQHLSKYGEFRCSPQGQELEKQRNIQFNHSLSFLPHEIALAARRFETAITKFETWHRKESIKAAGNAVVPQVVYEIFKTIEATRK